MGGVWWLKNRFHLMWEGSFKAPTSLQIPACPHSPRHPSTPPPLSFVSVIRESVADQALHQTLFLSKGSRCQRRLLIHRYDSRQNVSSQVSMVFFSFFLYVQTSRKPCRLHTHAALANGTVDFAKFDLHVFTPGFASKAAWEWVIGRRALHDVCVCQRNGGVGFMLINISVCVTVFYPNAPCVTHTHTQREREREREAHTYTCMHISEWLLFSTQVVFVMTLAPCQSSVRGT